MRPTSVPARAGVGFKPEHRDAIVATRPSLGFFEVHAENYIMDGGPTLRMLEALRADYPLSLHGVGLSIGGAGPLDRDHLARLKRVADRFEPGLFSEHLAWASHGEHYLNDLLPLPYTPATLATVVEHVDQVQTALGRRMLLENPATYLTFAESEIAEVEFLRRVAERTGCGLLLDVNNVFVSAANHGFDPRGYLTAFPLHLVGEVHLAGHTETSDAGLPLLIDAHGSPVAEPVWTLYAEVIARTGALPSLIEWDNDVPAFAVLAAEAARADAILATAGRRADAA
jgi:uncharacterized protein (UPF0276 family)